MRIGANLSKVVPTLHRWRLRNSGVQSIRLQHTRIPDTTREPLLHCGSYCTPVGASSPENLCSTVGLIEHLSEHPHQRTSAPLRVLLNTCRSILTREPLLHCAGRIEHLSAREGRSIVGAGDRPESDLGATAGGPPASGCRRSRTGTFPAEVPRFRRGRPFPVVGAGGQKRTPSGLAAAAASDRAAVDTTSPVS